MIDEIPPPPPPRGKPPFIWADTEDDGGSESVLGDEDEEEREDEEDGIEIPRLDICAMNCCSISGLSVGVGTGEVAMDVVEEDEEEDAMVLMIG